MLLSPRTHLLHLKTLAVLLGVCGLASACATPSKRATGAKAPSPRTLATRAAQARYGDAVQRAAARQERVARDSQRNLVGRYNKAPCACPAFEILLRGQWTRVQLAWVDTPTEQNPLYAIEDRALDVFMDNQHPLYIIQGRLTQERFTAPNENAYPIVQITGVRQLGDQSLTEAIRASTGAAPLTPSSTTPPQPAPPPSAAPAPPPAPDANPDDGQDGEQDDIDPAQPPDAATPDAEEAP